METESPNNNAPVTGQEGLPPAGQPLSPLTPESPAKKKWLVPVIIVAVLVIAGLVAWMMLNKTPTTTTTKTIQKPAVTVGVAAPFSGGASGAGAGAKKGYLLAKKQLAADHITLVEVDTQCDADKAKLAFQELVTKNVVAVIGDSCSGSSKAVLELANQNKVPMVSASASSPALSIPNDYFFRVIPPDEYQGAFTAKLLYDKGIKKVATIYSDEDYGKGLNKVFTDEFTKLGGTVVSDNPFPGGSLTVSTQVEAIKAANPEAVYMMSNFSVSSIAVLKQLQTVGVKVPIYGSDSANDNAILSEAGTAAEGLLITSFASGPKSFKQTLADEYPSDNFLYAAAEAYDAFQAIYEAVGTGATTGEQVKSALEKVDFQGLSGHIKFNANGELTDQEHQYDILVAKDGTFIPTE